MQYRIYFLILAGISGGFCADPFEISWQSGLETALQKSPKVLEAQTRVHLADAKKTQFWSVILPHVDLSARTLPSTIDLSIEEQVYGQGIPAQYRSARLGEYAAQANLELALVETVFAFRDAYSRALLAQKVAALREEYADHLEKSVQGAPGLFEAGKMTKANVTRLQVRAALARDSAQGAKITEQQALLALERMMGVDHIANARLSGEFRDEAPSERNPAKLIPIAYEQRRDLWLAENLRLASYEKIHVEAAPAFPELFVFTTIHSDPGRLGFRTGYSFDFQRRNEGTNEKPADFSTTLRVGTELRWSIFDGGFTRGKVKAAEADAIGQEELVRRIKRDIPAQVKGTLELVDESLRQVELTKAITPDEAVRLAQSDFESGKANHLDLLDTQELALRQKEFKYLALTNLEISRASLDRATGLGIRFTRVNASTKKD